MTLNQPSERTNELVEVSTLMKKERAEFKRSHPSSSEMRGRGAADRVDLNRLTQMVTSSLNIHCCILYSD